MKLDLGTAFSKRLLRRGSVPKREKAESAENCIIPSPHQIVLGISNENG
jgi:hypothetical protein